ncbi:adiponectin receptor protein 1 [Metarhizium guizhouense ARSEF 977]|uniref:Adiponectin receptor protein 1 n=1 Tax=Metarhizium guizhouense (strain ARSEF 977) TaxID=1276136 RepID=A0A0B4H379_METGA|nr:adiponectin receptor protein 1 [Metarhizium guizhouense ARSEF 977]
MESEMRQRLSLLSRIIIPTFQRMPRCCEKPRRDYYFSSTSCQNGQRTTSTFVPAGGPRRICTGNASKALDTSTTNPATYTFISLQPSGWSCWGHGGACTQRSGIQTPTLMTASSLFPFFLGAIVCYLLSTTYHVLSNHSHATHLFCLELDFLGILAVTAGCFSPGLWYTFSCASRRVKFTWIAVDLAAQFLATMLAIFVKSFQAPKTRPLRGLVFSAMASSAFYPIIIKILQVGWSRADAEYGASFDALTILIYLYSVTTYASWKPGCFDIWGHSHQIFHVGMAIGRTVHFLAFARALDQFYAIKQG